MSPTVIWVLPLLLVLLYGIYVAEADYHRGPCHLPTTEEKLETPQYSGQTRAKRSLLDGTVNPAYMYKDRFIIGEHKWEACKENVYEIPDQGNCGICHSAAGAGVISNRWCIALAEKWLNHIPEDRRGTFKDQISAFHVAACHDHFPAPEPTAEDRCTTSSTGLRVFRHGVFTGYVTGGSYDRKDGCIPYPFSQSQEENLLLTCPDKKNPPPPTCSNKDYKKLSQQEPHQIYQQDFRQTDSYWSNDASQITDNSIVQRMKYEISTYGPILASVYFPDDFKTATLIQNGDRLAILAKDQICNHGVRIIGWDTCETANGEKLIGKICWLVANSWGKDAHWKGILMIEIGHNLLNIEQSLSAPVISLQGKFKPCQASDFLTNAIDSAVYIKDGLYLFQGHCTQRLRLEKGNLEKAKLVREGPPDLIQRIFVGAPPTIANVHAANNPVKVGSSDVFDDFDPIILDSRGEGVRIYKRGTGASARPVKYICRWMFVKDFKPEETGGLYADGEVVRRFGVSQFKKASVLAPGQFVDVNAMVYVGQGLMAIFGQDREKAFIAGVFRGFDDPDYKQTSSWIVKPVSQSQFLESVDDDGSPRDGAAGRDGPAKRQKS